MSESVADEIRESVKTGNQQDRKPAGLSLLSFTTGSKGDSDDWPGTGIPTGGLT